MEFLRVPLQSDQSFLILGAIFYLAENLSGTWLFLQLWQAALADPNFKISDFVEENHF